MAVMMKRSSQSRERKEVVAGVKGSYSFSKDPYLM